MQPLLIFLGTGQGPEVVTKQLRGSGGIILKTKDNQIHIDPGPSSQRMARMFKLNPRETNCILVSHHHLNHCNDVNSAINSMTYGGLDKRGILISTNTLINGDESTRPYLTDFHKNCLEKFMVVKEEEKVGIDDIDIKITKTRHSVESIGFSFFAPEFSASLITDTGFGGDILDQEETDVLVLNVVNPFEITSEHNLNSDDAVSIIKTLKPRLAVITHFSIKMLQADPIIQAREISKQTGKQVIAASDGLSINLPSYSSRRRQKTQ